MWGKMTILTNLTIFSDFETLGMTSLPAAERSRNTAALLSFCTVK